MMLEASENNDELFEHFSFTADKGQEPIRVDKFLMNRVENATRNKIQKAAKNGYIFSNDIAVKQNYKVSVTTLKCNLEKEEERNFLIKVKEMQFLQGNRGEL